MAAKFRSILPKLLPEKVFQDAFVDAAQKMAKDAKGSFEDATENWKTKPVFRSYTRIDSRGMYISITTTDKIFGYVDQGTAPHIIKPVRVKFLHWVDPVSGEDHFATIVHHPGYAGAKISESVQEIWAGLMPVYFDDALRKAVKESGHAI